MYNKDLIEVDGTHSTTIRITIIDRKNDNGILRSTEKIKLFDRREEKEANRYYMEAIDECIHYCIIKETISISSTIRYDENFRRG